MRDPPGLMRDLLTLIRPGTLDACRNDLSRHQARSQARCACGSSVAAACGSGR